MRVSGIPLGVTCQQYIQWDVTSTHEYTKTESANRAMLLSAAVATGSVNEEWLAAVEQHSYANTSAITLNITANNTISSNPYVNGVSHLVKAKCYDADGNLLGYVGFGYTFSSAGSTKYGVYVIRDVAGYSYSEQSVGLNVPAFDADDVFILSVDTETREWDVSKDGNKADGGSLIGLMPANTAYVKYEVSFFVGYSVVATAEINILSVQ